MVQYMVHVYSTMENHRVQSENQLFLSACLLLVFVYPQYPSYPNDYSLSAFAVNGAKPNLTHRLRGLKMVMWLEQ